MSASLPTPLSLKCSGWRSTAAVSPNWLVWVGVWLRVRSVALSFLTPWWPLFPRQGFCTASILPTYPLLLLWLPDPAYFPADSLRMKTAALLPTHQDSEVCSKSSRTLPPPLHLSAHQMSFKNQRMLIHNMVARMVKNLPTMQETQVQSLSREDSLEKGMATHSSILAWEIP